MIEKYSNNKVDAYQYFALVVFLSRSMFTGMGAQNMIEMSRNDTWVSLLIGFCIGMPLVLLICYINSKEINMFELINKYFSKVISKIINFIIVKITYLFQICTYHQETVSQKFIHLKAICI